MYNIFHRLSSEELEVAVIEYLAVNGRHDIITKMISNDCRFSIAEDGDLLCQALKATKKKSEEG